MGGRTLKTPTIRRQAGSHDLTSVIVLTNPARRKEAGFFVSQHLIQTIFQPGGLTAATT
jgi:hypothetical protein